MAAGRKIKLGIDYFPLQVSLFSDMKIRRLIRDCGGQAVIVYLSLLCNIYRDGYFLKWFKDIPFLVSEETKLDEAYVWRVVESCLEHGLFSKDLFEKNGVLTSKGIQERYKLICDLSRRKIQIIEYSLISSEEMPINSETIPISSEEMPINSDLIPRRKVKELKGNEGNELHSLKFKYNREQELELKTELENSSVWQADVCRNLQRHATFTIMPDFIVGKIPEFMIDLASKSKYPISLNESREYFSNWMGLKLRSTSKIMQALEEDCERLD